MNRSRLLSLGAVTCVLAAGLPLGGSVSQAVEPSPQACGREQPLVVQPSRTWHLGHEVTASVAHTERGPGAPTSSAPPSRSRIAYVAVPAGSARVQPWTAGLPLMTAPATAVRQHKVMATINGDYFETMREGDALPWGMVVSDGRVLYSPVIDSHSLVVDREGKLRAAKTHLHGRLRGAEAEARIDAVNDPSSVRSSIVAFTSDWQRSVPARRWTLLVKSTGAARLVMSASSTRVPRAGYAITAPTEAALRPFAGKARVSVILQAKARDGGEVAYASGHGGVSLHRGHIQAYCSEYEKALRPRSAIAWNAAGDVWLLTASSGLSDPADGVRVGGATKWQLARFAKGLGATESVVLDGGGSTALFVNRPTTKRIDLPAGTWVRPVSVVWNVLR